MEANVSIHDHSSFFLIKLPDLAVSPSFLMSKDSQEKLPVRLVTTYSIFLISSFHLEMKFYFIFLKQQSQKADWSGLTPVQARLACSGGLCGGKIGVGLKQIARGGPSRQAQLSKGPGHLSLSQGVEVGVGIEASLDQSAHQRPDSRCCATQGQRVSCSRPVPGSQERRKPTADC